MSVIWRWRKIGSPAVQYRIQIRDLQQDLLAEETWTPVRPKWCGRLIAVASSISVWMRRLPLPYQVWNFQLASPIESDRLVL